MKLWCYSKANIMKNHNFSDDVAICEADTIEEAIGKFQKMYSDENLIENIKEVEYNCFGVFVATDY